MPRADFHWIDFSVVIVYMLAMLGIGAYSLRRKQTATEYLLASRSIGWFAIGLSLLASLNSAADYVIGPAQILEYGFLNLVMILPVFLSFPIIFRYFLPFYQRLKVYHCYEYLEHRFSLGVRLMATVLFVIWRITWMGATIYLPAFVLNEIMGLPLYTTILFVGAITTLYTVLGGVRGVIWTDVVQAIIMFSGLVLAMWLVVREVPGGFGQVWAISRDEGFMYFTAKIPEMSEAKTWVQKVHLYLSADLTFWSIILLGTMSKLTSYGADQVMVQRYLASRSLRDSKRGFVLNSIAYIAYSVLFLALGMGLFAYFKLNPLPEAVTYKHMFPHFIGAHMPLVVKGLIIAAIYAAAQSSVSSGLTAATSGIYADFYLRLAHGHTGGAETTDALTEGQKVWFSRICALCLGICVTLFACVFAHLSEQEGLFAAFRLVVGIFEGLLIPIFLLGMFSRRVGSLGVGIGALCGFVASFYWGFGTDLGFGWNTIVAFVVTVTVAHVVSLVTPPPDEAHLAWRWRAVMDREGG